MEKNKEEESREFRERKELIKLQGEADETRHKFKMEELAYERDNARIFHEQILERGRITRAENKKMFAEKNASYFSKR